MTIDYKMSLSREKKLQPLVVFFLHRKKTVPAVIFTLATVLFGGIGLVFSIDLFKWGFLFFFPAAYFVCFWLNMTRRRCLSLARLYRLHSTKIFTYTLTESDGVIRDFCNETRQCNELKRSEIARTFSLSGAYFVICYSGKVSTYPDNDEIRNFFKGRN